MVNWIYVKDAVVCICLTVGGVYALEKGDSSTAGFCFGGIAGYVMKNGYNSMKKKEEFIVVGDDVAEA